MSFQQWAPPLQQQVLALLLQLSLWWGSAPCTPPCKVASVPSTTFSPQSSLTVLLSFSNDSPTARQPLGTQLECKCWLKMILRSLQLKIPLESYSLTWKKTWFWKAPCISPYPAFPIPSPRSSCLAWIHRWALWFTGVTLQQSSCFQAIACDYNPEQQWLKM